MHLRRERTRPWWKMATNAASAGSPFRTEVRVRCRWVFLLWLWIVPLEDSSTSMLHALDQSDRQWLPIE